jgi:hypothetical protein
MSVQIKTCIVVLCDSCGDDVYDGWDCIPHYESIEQAIEDLTDADWRLSDTDGSQICGRCANTDDCARNGHLMSSWQPCLCQWDHVTLPATSPCGHRWRYCAHCDGGYEVSDGPEPVEAVEPVEPAESDGR